MGEAVLVVSGVPGVFVTQHDHLGSRLMAHRSVGRMLMLIPVGCGLLISEHLALVLALWPWYEGFWV